MKTDICGCQTSLSDSTALTAWNAMAHGVLAHSAKTPDHLATLLEAAPDFAMGHAAKGLFCLMMGRRELISVAQQAHEAACAVPSTIHRETLWVAALGDWLNGSPSGAVARMETQLDAAPHDTLSAKISQAIRFILGDTTGMRRSVERVLPAHEPDHALRGYLMGCHAFALEETGDYIAAETTGHAGLALAPDDAWGLHAVAHVYDMTARPDQGIALIDTNRSAWDHCNNFRYHVWWHKALLHLDRGEYDIALSLYDDEIRADKTDDYRDIANATSLLMRLELDGIAVGDRWEELAALSAARTQDGCLVFADLHYMLALAGAGRGDARADLTTRFARQAQNPGEMAARIADPGQAAIAGLNAFAEARFDQAFRHLAAARPAMQTIGGSHAQRDVFERMTIDAGLRAGFADQTDAILAERIARRGGAQDRFSSTRLAALADIRRIPAQ